MRSTLWRRVLVALALIVGAGLGVSSAPATAAPVSGGSGQQSGAPHSVVAASGDWWW
jgi:hypothetical protein